MKKLNFPNYDWYRKAEQVTSVLGGAGIFLVAAADGRLSALLKFISGQRVGVNVISDWIHHGELVYNQIPADFS